MRIDSSVIGLILKQARVEYGVRPLLTLVEGKYIGRLERHYKLQEAV